jgi:hypothetical protein
MFVSHLIINTFAERSSQHANKDETDSQAKQFIFLIIEPNCSIIAACLPTYGPLFSSWGGRAPESIVRSVRSILSLGSRHSSPKNSIGNTQHAKRLPDTNDGSLKSDSQIELRQWPAGPAHDVQVHADPSGSGSLPPNARNGINVTNGVSIDTEQSGRRPHHM